MFPEISESSSSRTKRRAANAYASQIGSTNTAKVSSEPAKTSSRNTESDISESEKEPAGPQTRTADPAEEKFSGPQEEIDVIFVTDFVAIFFLEPQCAAEAQKREDTGVTRHHRKAPSAGASARQPTYHRVPAQASRAPARRR